MLDSPDFGIRVGLILYVLVFLWNAPGFRINGAVADAYSHAYHPTNVLVCCGRAILSGPFEAHGTANYGFDYYNGRLLAGSKTKFAEAHNASLAH